jgi:hypothetical protein
MHERNLVQEVAMEKAKAMRLAAYVDRAFLRLHQKCSASQGLD